MSNIKISQLPTYTGSVAGTWFVIDNPTLTETYKVLRENIEQFTKSRNRDENMIASMLLSDLNKGVKKLYDKPVTNINIDADFPLALVKKQNEITRINVTYRNIKR